MPSAVDKNPWGFEREGGMEGGREGGRGRGEGGREGGREGRWEGGRERGERKGGGREGERDEGREQRREGGKEGRKEGGKEGRGIPSMTRQAHTHTFIFSIKFVLLSLWFGMMLHFSLHLLHAFHPWPSWHSS